MKIHFKSKLAATAATVKNALTMRNNKIFKSFKGEYGLWILSLAISCCFLWSAFFGQHGVFHFFQLKKSVSTVRENNIALAEENQNLEKEIYLLRNSAFHIEKIAREEYGYIYKGERIYLFPESN